MLRTPQYLLTHDAAHPAQIAREAYYFERAGQGTLADMSRSGGAVAHRQSGEALLAQARPVAAVAQSRRAIGPEVDCLAPWFSALEQIWRRLRDTKLHDLEPWLQASEVRQLLATVRPALERAGFDRALADDRPHLGESHLPVFMADVKQLLT